MRRAAAAALVLGVVGVLAALALVERERFWPTGSSGNSS